MPNVVPFARFQKRRNLELELALERALEMVRAGRCTSGVLGFIDERGKEYVVIEGVYRVSSGALSNFGFKLQAMAADSGFG